ncbi:TonB-dependent receptor [Nitritalea halalkaliphila]|uniref:TonB-dependent receptor n=1 Tax=Nitritalea halalkaliphila TaxID=590849 RepID=UPI0009FEAC0F|nr:TonB-dependent receptor [Nitritalea halalkaliphila]
MSYTRATVRIKELAQAGTTTSANGTFSLTALQAGAYTLEVSFIGFRTQTLEVSIRAGEVSSVEVQLQESDVLLEGAVVTAQRREQTIQKVPVAVTAYEKTFFNDFNIREVDALSEFVPGLQVQLQSPNNPGFVIRGITSDDGDSRVEPRVSVFQDGVAISKSRGSVVELFDMERVEVLKGPQGTLFGRGAQIGAVHFIQNKAQRDFAGELTLGYGNFNQQLASGFINTPLSDKVFFRVAGQFNRRDGFIENLAGGRLNGKETAAVRGALRWLASPKTVVDVIYNYQKDNFPGTAFISGTIAPPGQEPSPFGPATLERGEELGIDRNVWGGTVLVDHELTGNLTLNSITAYREFFSDEAFDADGSALPALSFSEIAFGRQFSQELRFTYDNKSNFSGFFGGSYFYEQGFQRVPFETNENSFVALVSPVLNELSGGAFPVLPRFNPDGSPFLAAGALLGIPFKDRHTEMFQNNGQVQAYESSQTGPTRQGTGP